MKFGRSTTLGQTMSYLRCPDGTLVESCSPIRALPECFGCVDRRHAGRGFGLE